MLELEDIVVWLNLFAGLLSGQSGFASLLLAHKGGPTGRLGYSDAGHSCFLWVPPDGDSVPQRWAGRIVCIVERERCAGVSGFGAMNCCIVVRQREEIF